MPSPISFGHFLNSQGYAHVLTLAQKLLLQRVKPSFESILRFPILLQLYDIIISRFLPNVSSLAGRLSQLGSDSYRDACCRCCGRTLDAVRLRQAELASVYTTISRSTELPQLTNNTIIVILGASGDLAKKFLYPALFKLFSRNLLPQHIAIVGYARSRMTHDQFLTTATANIRNLHNHPDFEQTVAAYKTKLSYFAGSYNDGVTFRHFNKYLESIESSYQSPERNRVFYLALPTFLFTVVVGNLKEHLYSTAGINRIVIEKPIGNNLNSARELVQVTGQFWSDDESFRVSHYLGEEIVKNVLVFRCANKITNGYWERQQMTHLLTVSLCDYSDFAADLTLPKSLQQMRRFVHHKVIATSPELILSALKA